MTRAILIPAAAVLVLILGFVGYLLLDAHATIGSLREELLRTTTESKTIEAGLTERLSEKTDEVVSLEGAFRLLEEKHEDSERQRQKLSGTVEDLEKVIATDTELLAKYSKVYFLNENYEPSKLAPISSSSTLQHTRTYQVHAEVAPYLEELLEEAAEDGFSLLVVSAYRSFDEQAVLKSGYRVRYGAGANAFSAEQGYSEHQLGTTIDFSTPALAGSFTGFDKTDAYVWLTENAWKYGFVLSYPKGNTYYQYEPWHWRFVGKDLAKRLHKDEEWFYDLDQRTIDSYLGTLFD